MDAKHELSQRHAIPGQWAGAAAVVAAPAAIAGGTAIAGGLYFGPGAVTYGTINILGNPIITIEIITNFATLGPPTPSQTGASYVGKAMRFGYTELANRKGF